jgi:ABC-type transport system substrate-binding protein
VLRRYSQDEDLEGRLTVNPADAVAYVTMNLTQPPFDDVHVRRAVSFVLDKAGLQKAWGGPLKGEVATHILPDTLLGGSLSGYDPYPSPGHAGDVGAARKEMRLSRYDGDGDGLCDAAACEEVFTLSAPVETVRAMEPVLAESLAKIGIRLETREAADPFAVLGTVRKQVALSSLASWGKDFADPSTFMVLFDGRGIVPQGNVNFSLVGLTPDHARQVGAEGSIEGIPSIDEQIDRCTALLDQPRIDCFAALDRRLMEEVVPSVPYLDRTNVDVLGPAVSAWEYDQFSGITAYSHVAVDTSKQR